MGLFSKTTHKEVCLPFIYDQYSPEHTDDVKCGVICIEAYGIIDGMERYFYSGFTLKDPAMYDNGDFDWMIHYLKSTPKKVVVNLKFKGQKLVDFEMLPKSLATAYDDNRFMKLERIGWGINCVSCRHQENGNDKPFSKAFPDEPL